MSVCGCNVSSVQTAAAAKKPNQDSRRRRYVVYTVQSITVVMPHVCMRMFVGVTVHEQLAKRTLLCGVKHIHKTRRASVEM